MGSIMSMTKKTSVFIPCIFDHWHYLSMLIECYNYGTIKPDEIVIFMSGVEEKKFGTNKNVVHQTWNIEKSNFDLKIIIKENVFMPSEARNQALDVCAGEIIIMQDADDLPTPNRVESILNAFESYTIDVFIHGYMLFEDYYKKRCGIFNHKTFYKKDKIFDEDKNIICPTPLTFGAATYSRKVLSEKKYVTPKNGEFTQFTGEDILMAQNCSDYNVMATNEPLYIYRNKSPYYDGLIKRELEK